jgi:hypothetical protein
VVYGREPFNFVETLNNHVADPQKSQEVHRKVGEVLKDLWDKEEEKWAQAKAKFPRKMKMVPGSKVLLLDRERKNASKQSLVYLNSLYTIIERKGLQCTNKSDTDGIEKKCSIRHLKPYSIRSDNQIFAHLTPKMLHNLGGFESVGQNNRRFCQEADDWWTSLASSDSSQSEQIEAEPSTNTESVSQVAGEQGNKQLSTDNVSQAATQEQGTMQLSTDNVSQAATQKQGNLQANTDHVSQVVTQKGSCYSPAKNSEWEEAGQQSLSLRQEVLLT